ncbi:MAG: porin, partial [Rhodospirillaceae bacterium]|nr:porin [Rhodospirillaceae bacterium]
MKKILLGSTAIVAAGMIVSAPSAIAAEKLKLSVGGYMEQW